MSGSFVQRELRFTITLGHGQFGESGSNKVVLSGYRASARITTAGQWNIGQAQVTIFGLSMDIMAQVNTLGVQFHTQTSRLNSLQIEAGDAVNGFELIYEGIIFTAFIQGQAQPDVAMVFLANVGYLSSVKPAAPTSYAGSVGVAVVLANLANVIGVSLENNGVTATLTNPYFAGSPMQQIQQAAQAADIDWKLDGERGPLAIWPKNGSRKGTPFVYSPETGLIGYPTFTQAGVNFSAVFTPGQTPLIAKPVQLQSSIKGATGTWLPVAIYYALDARTPGGAWQMDLTCYSNDAPGQSAVASGAK